MNTTFLIGSDPELTPYIYDVPKEAGTFLKHGKDNPLQISDITHVHTDNVNFELSIKPAKSLKEWQEYNTKSFESLKEFTTKLENNLELHAVPFTQYGGPASLKEIASFIFGCEPDYNAWTGDINVSPAHVLDELEDYYGTFRTAGGHIHIGLDKKLSDKNKCLLVQRLDINLKEILNSYEINKSAGVRRRLYGKSGSMRFKNYGLEYRVPGPEWFTNTDAQEMLYEGIHKSISELYEALSTGKIKEFQQENTEKMYYI